VEDHVAVERFISL